MTNEPWAHPTVTHLDVAQVEVAEVEVSEVELVELAVTEVDVELESAAEGSSVEHAPAEPDRRQHLVDEAEVLGSQLGDDAGAGHDENFADSGQVAAEQSEALTLAAGLREQLDDVQRALAKLDDGTYGRCEVCSQPIGDDRLEAMPAARYCIEHAQG